ncbi:SusD/RagB family nutrient-binding outer membrane lipoprotein [Hymenobacter weizhouensis]|uniref:SusD/RagB family nutrient-binding outer membrane lipoprotein n=1 Tax=Hymenobacter sp. YIM 151500-1 TaxID=2987689 RepID=UPI0022265DE9|nr:SusD/RagB family nutrient-binding outer membrane lipoprotein [Hymenobacter sp. YIM 151500-1]UYZ62595.1 SusD/RagB family nutrient-binding outer membrane lipoprotein [Hymenobacter sp. YIM 151500-1]
MKLTTLRWVAALGLLLGSTACEKELLDINKDPNNPATADVSLVLPSGQGTASFIMGGQYNILGEILAQHMGAMGAQYRGYDQYNLSSGTLDGFQFQALYAGALRDFEYVIQEGTKSGEWRMVGIAKILKAHTFQVLTDLYGDLPFSQALQPEVTITPAYDKQRDIYAGLHTLLTEAVADIGKKQGRFPGLADLHYRAATEADMNRWVRLANTLRLKLYLRTSEVDPAGAQAGVAGLFSRLTTTDFMLSGEDFQFNHTANAGAENPFYQANSRLPNQLAVSRTLGSSVIINPAQGLVDPRFRVYFVDWDLSTPSVFDFFFREPGSSDGFRWSTPGPWFFGQNFANANNRPAADFPGIPATDAPAKARPTLLLTYEESLFLRAEAAVRGWSTEGAQAITLYNNGVAWAMGRYGITAAEYNTYIANPRFNLVGVTTTPDRIGRIIWQKWISLYGTNGLEAWAEARRTDGILSSTGQPPIPLRAPLVNFIGGNRLIKRLPYPDSELQRNPNVSSTGLAPGDIVTPVWWDVK